jgi:hypothetical protein
MDGFLRGDNRRPYLSTVVHHGGRRFVAGGFYTEYDHGYFLVVGCLPTAAISIQKPKWPGASPTVPVPLVLPDR